MNDTYAALDRASTHAQAWLESLPRWAVSTAATSEQLLSALDTLPEDPTKTGSR